MSRDDPERTQLEESHASPSLAPERLLSTLEQLVSQNDVAGCRWRSGVQYDPSDSAALFALNESGDGILHFVANMKPLKASAIQSRSDIAKILVECGVLLEARNSRNQTALIVAVLNAIEVYQDGQMQMARLVSEVSPPVNENVRLVLVRAFLDMKADVNSVDEDDGTLLMHAAAARDYDLCKLLIEHGADVSLQNSIGLLAKDFAQDNDNVYTLLANAESTRHEPEDSPIDTSSKNACMTTSEHATSSFSNGEIARTPVAFFGICDLKYDGQKKKDSQVKVLELGNGLASKFSGCGEHIPKNCSRKYKIFNKLDRDMLVNNKKLTHDVLFDAGYGDLLPQQASFNRSYTPDLHERIARELDLRNDGEETVVLKLLNRCRGAGVVVTRIGSALDQMLHRLLNPPKAWTDASPEVELDAALAVDPDVENCRHWWANESPIFLAERCETSCQLKKEAGLFDPTMRIGFVVIRTGEPEAPFRIKFLGGYWKLPAAPVSSADVHTRCVSKAASKGTAEVVPEDLKMVYCQLRIPLADAFGVDIRLELPLFSLRYEQTFCSFLQMSSAMARMKKDNGDNGKKLQFPSKVTKKLLESPAHGFKLNHRNMSCMAAASHVERQLGCKAAMLGDWIGAAQRWTRSLEMYGWNASSEHLLGLHSLRSKEYQTAERHLRTSLAMDPDFKATYANLSAAYLGLDSYESAEKVAQEGLRRWPDFPECSYNLGVAITMSLATEIRAPIGNRQKELRARSRNAVYTGCEKFSMKSRTALIICNFRP